MTQYTLDTLDNYALKKSYKETTGGLASTHLSRTMWTNVPRASNTRSIDTCQTHPATGQEGKYLPIFVNHHGLHHQSPRLWWLRFYHGHSGPWISEGGNSRTLHQDHWCSRDWEDSTWLTLLMIWTTRQGYLRQRPTICIPHIQRTRISKLIYPYSAATTLTNGNHYSQPSNSLTTRNHMLPRKNPHCSYKWDTTPSLSPQLIPRPMYLALKSNYCHCKKHEKKVMLCMNLHNKRWWNKSHADLNHSKKVTRCGWSQDTSNSAMKARN